MAKWSSLSEITKGKSWCRTACRCNFKPRDLRSCSLTCGVTVQGVCTFYTCTFYTDSLRSVDEAGAQEAIATRGAVARRKRSSSARDRTTEARERPAARTTRRASETDRGSRTPACAPTAEFHHHVKAAVIRWPRGSTT